MSLETCTENQYTSTSLVLVRYWGVPDIADRHECSTYGSRRIQKGPTTRKDSVWQKADRSSMAAPLVLDAFERAVKNWSNLPVLHHSDRGVQYASSGLLGFLVDGALPTRV
jgi:transposase InsO family protein